MNQQFNWRMGILILTTSVISLAQNFQFTSDVELQSVYEMDWSKVSKYRKSGDCYPFGKGNSYSALGHETLTISARHSGGGATATKVVSQAHDFTLGSMSSGTTIKENNRVEFFVNDSTNWSAYFHRGDSKCVLREHHWKIASNKVIGKANVSFQLPENIWVAKVKLSGITNGEVQLAKSVTGDLHQAVIENNEVIVWGVPGQIISVAMSVNKNNSSNDIVRFEMQVEPFTQGIVPTHNDWLDIQKKLAMRGTNKIELAQNFLALGSDLLKDKNGGIQLANSMGTSSYKALLDWLFMLANGDNPEFGKYDRHVKAMSAAIGYYLAMSLLDDLNKFCVNIDVYMPLSDRTVKTNGLAAANYWINRDVRRLSAIQFPEIRAYLVELIRWENNGMSYSDIAKDPKEFSKLKDGYVKIRKHSQLSFDIFGDIKIGLNKSISVFGSYGTSELIGHEINNYLTDLGKARAALNLKFEKEVMSFTLKNNEKIKSSEVLGALDDLESKTKFLSENLLSKIKFVTLDQSQSSNSVLELMTSLLAHQVAIFEKPLNSPFAEPIRKAFAQTDRARGLNQNFRECLGMN